MHTMTGVYRKWPKRLVKKKEYEQFIKRAGNYKNVFDTATKYIRMKHKDGCLGKRMEPVLLYFI